MHNWQHAFARSVSHELTLCGTLSSQDVLCQVCCNCILEVQYVCLVQCVRLPVVTFAPDSNSLTAQDCEERQRLTHNTCCCCSKLT